MVLYPVGIVLWLDMVGLGGRRPRRLRGEGGEAGQELVLYVVCVDGCFDGGGGGVVVIGEEAR